MQLSSKFKEYLRGGFESVKINYMLNEYVLNFREMAKYFVGDRSLKMPINIQIKRTYNNQDEKYDIYNSIKNDYIDFNNLSKPKTIYNFMQGMLFNQSLFLFEMVINFLQI